MVGGGLAGSECAYQLARRGVPVVLHEMRPVRSTPAHQTGDLAELVCSNSLRSDDPQHAAGLLKREMEAFGSLVEAKLIVEDWRRSYNEQRPHSSLGYQTPAAFAATVHAATCSAALRTSPHGPGTTLA